jgi:hypothetical protein
MTGRVQALALALALFAAPAAAQTSAPIQLSVQPPAPAPSAQLRRAPAVGPVLRTSAVGTRSLHATEQPLTPTPAAVSTMAKSESRAMMFIGGGAIVIGAIVGGAPGAVVAVAGVVVGLVGAYNYFD